MRIIISEPQYDQLSESKMRAWEYIDAINNISNDFIWMYKSIKFTV